MKATVSIIVPCYNQAQYLDEALQSVLDQTYTDWECIIVNDGSPDNTEEVAKKWLQLDSRFKYIYQGNAGLSAARNVGISSAKGEFILPLDSDDKIGKDYLRLALGKFREDSNLKVIYCRADYFGTKSGEWHLEEFSLAKLAVRNVIFCSALFRKDDWARVGGFDIKMIYGFEDWEFWISILKDGGDVHRINEVLFFYRSKNASMITKLKEHNLEEMYDYISIKHADLFVKIFGSFQYLVKKNNYLTLKMQSEKHLINSFTIKYLGLKIFNLSDPRQ